MARRQAKKINPPRKLDAYDPHFYTGCPHCTHGFEVFVESPAICPRCHGTKPESSFTRPEPPRAGH